MGGAAGGSAAGSGGGGGGAGARVLNYVDFGVVSPGSRTLVRAIEMKNLMVRGGLKTLIALLLLPTLLLATHAIVFGRSVLFCSRTTW